MVSVAVGEQDRVGLDLVGRRRRERVAGQERVGEDRRAAGLELEARLAQESDVDRHQESPFISICASSYPTATPTSMLRRVSPATRVCTAVTRSSGSAVPAAFRTSTWCSAPNQSADASA